MKTDNYTPEELSTIEEHTANIAGNLRYIENHAVYQGEDLKALSAQIGHICTLIEYIGDRGVSRKNLEALEERLAGICASLKYMEDRCQNWNLDELAKQASEIAYQPANHR
jgi:hypothetical protein